MAWKGKVMEFIPYCAEEAFQFFSTKFQKNCLRMNIIKGN